MTQLAAAVTCIALVHSLFFGVTDTKVGGEVSKLQTFFGISPTGYFGPITSKAVQGWQAFHNIASVGVLGYGVVGPKTRAALACGSASTITPALVATTTIATTSPFLANIPSLFGSSTTTTSTGVSSATKDLLIGVILSEQKMYVSSDASAMRTFLVSSTADEPTLSASYLQMTDDTVQSFLPLMHSIGSSIPSEASLRAPNTAWQVSDTKASIQVGDTTVTLKKINGVWY